MPSFFLFQQEVFQNKRCKQYCHYIHYFYQWVYSRTCCVFCRVTDGIAHDCCCMRRVLGTIWQSLSAEISCLDILLGIIPGCSSCCHHESKKQTRYYNADQKTAKSHW